MDICCIQIEKNSLCDKIPFIEIIDITEEYKKKTANGQIKYEDGYDRSLHKDEIAMAEWLTDNFGGVITLLREASDYSRVMPDYDWNGRLWELKTPSSVKASDRAIQKALSLTKAYRIKK